MMGFYVARKIGRSLKPGASKARARQEQEQREVSLAFLARIEATTRRWADAVNKKETK
jgi:hypothetical protein